MDILTACIHGVLLALGLIIPLGVQNIFVFNQGAAASPFRKAMPSFITAALCDTTLIILAVLGVSLLIFEIAWLKNIIFAVGFIFLMYMGWVTWKQHASNINARQRELSAKKQILFAMSVSILNPHAIIDTIVVIGTNAVAYSGYSKLAYTLSCIGISWIWFASLAFAGHNMHKLDKNGLWIKAVNKLAAIIIWCIALYIARQLFESLFL